MFQVDVWSDVVCPWCYVGKRRLESGIEEFRRTHPGAEFQVEYHSFQLAPDLADDFDGTAVDYLRHRKGITEEQVKAMHGHVAEAAATVGLEYDFTAMKPANTARAHQLLHLAKSHDIQAAMKERLMRAHFMEGRHIGRVEELALLAAEVGLDPGSVIASLEAEEFATAVAADRQIAAEIGISGVPFYVIDRTYGISGAQMPETFVSVFERVSAES